ncbi:YrdB family protein [Ponticaulis sp.]|uniref:YrdB family protein n=1 Tax=Ponticaulis sp. TaxID=2020902 RepID=UPI000B715206|nr:YrdB family protein [Ponticaulis sp.]MAI89865.1 hypothetical protein [Ponticaulis sp.]OUX99539.1 MAG: hypothetical protein CBB65_05440 [Hyphomonadaceae bacterium TMED5]|tara:strand:- start:94436 stop:94789 length:354 start_codon:yes stop_codon:yes gene_type:complete
MNLILRFILELAALAGIGMAAFQFSDGVIAYLASILCVTTAATLWGVFNVPGDPSRSGHAPVRVSGPVRLSLELIILFGGSLSFYLAGYAWIALSHAWLITLHYAFSAQRVGWLLKQ